MKPPPLLVNESLLKSSQEDKLRSLFCQVDSSVLEVAEKKVSLYNKAFKSENSSNTYVTKTERAPIGVTKLAGANAYAAKLQASPIPIVITPIHQSLNVIFCVVIRLKLNNTILSNTHSHLRKPVD